MIQVTFPRWCDEPDQCRIVALVVFMGSPIGFRESLEMASGKELADEAHRRFLVTLREVAEVAYLVGLAASNRDLPMEAFEAAGNVQASLDHLAKIGGLT